MGMADHAAADHRPACSEFTSGNTTPVHLGERQAAVLDVGPVPSSFHPAAGPAPEGHEKAVQELLAGAWAENSRRAYRTGLKAFWSFCEAAGASPLPALPATIAAFIANLVARKVAYATVAVYVGAVRYAHHRKQLPLPTRHPVVLDALRGARRQLGVLPKGRKAAITFDRLAAMVGSIDTATPEGARDVALLLVGFGGGFRRSELATIRLRDVAIGPKGMLVFLPRSKTDQEGKGYQVEIARNVRDPDLCPVARVERWLAAMWKEGWLTKTSAAEAFLFPRSKAELALSVRPAQVARLVKRCAKAAGLDPKTVAGHSLRAGACTSAVRAGVADSVIQQHLRWRSPAMIAVYRREARPFEGGVGEGIYSKRHLVCR